MPETNQDQMLHDEAAETKLDNLETSNQVPVSDNDLTSDNQANFDHPTVQNPAIDASPVSQLDSQTSSEGALLTFSRIILGGSVILITLNMLLFLGSALLNAGSSGDGALLGYGLLLYTMNISLTPILVISSLFIVVSAIIKSARKSMYTGLLSLTLISVAFFVFSGLSSR